MPAPIGFTFATRKNGEVVISHHGRVATVLRGERAAKFLRAIATGDPQHVMARATGDYKRGNERR
ncbi:MAG: hypothetical protein WD184_10285 [Acidimicrobiia bacterium]